MRISGRSKLQSTVSTEMALIYAVTEKRLESKELRPRL